jgi:hypothetical protein
MLTRAGNEVLNLEVNNVTEKNSACREGSRRHAPCKKAARAAPLGHVCAYPISAGG